MGHNKQQKDRHTMTHNNDNNDNNDIIILCNQLDKLQLDANVDENENVNENEHIKYPILTRYLYVAFDVHYSLTMALGINPNNPVEHYPVKSETELPQMQEPTVDVMAAVFWACELYFSGFKENTICFLREITECVNLHKNKIMIKLFQEWDDNMENKNKRGEEIKENKMEKETDAIHFVNIVYNLACLIKRNNKNAGLGGGVPHTPQMLIRLKYKQICEYTDEEPPSDIRPYRVLENKCLYESHKNEEYCAEERKRVIQSMFDGKWLYYCYLTPIWKERIDAFSGCINHTEKTVDFPEEDKEILFYGKYGYEPDNNYNLVTPYLV